MISVSDVRLLIDFINVLRYTKPYGSFEIYGNKNVSEWRVRWKKNM